MKFAFYGRVSTEDQQDPESSRQWQLARSTSLIEPHKGVIVAEYFDVGTSRSLPWVRRPEAAALLEAFKQSDRGFDAVVIGEPSRAFYGSQFSLIFPLFDYWDVQLWVPEVGGRVEPESDAHELVMSLYGGMSKGERMRVKTRVRAAMKAQTVTEGRFLGGRPPYGYVIADAGPHPHPGKAATGQRMHKLELDPIAAPVARRIFDEWLAGGSFYAISSGLTNDGIASPSAHDPQRNAHRNGLSWAKSAIRAIVTNPKYTGFMVWNKQRRDEVLIDIDDVALGNESKMRWNGTDDWVWSTKPTHEAIVSIDEFEQAQSRLRVMKTTTTSPRKKRATSKHAYVLSGLIGCGKCSRRMSGNMAHGHTYYRCQFSKQYAVAANTDHPLSVNFRESAVLPQLDRWLAGLFEEASLSNTLDALVMAADDEPDRQGEVKARQVVKQCDDKIAKYRLMLEEGTDPTLVASWINEVMAQREAAERQIQRGKTAGAPSRESIKAQVEQLRAAYSDLANALAIADSEDKSILYSELGLEMIYHPERAALSVTVDPWRKRRVGERT